MLRLGCKNSEIFIAAEQVRNGATVVYPTDTVYGLGCDPHSSSAVESLRRIKGRGADKPMPLLCSSIDRASKIGEFDQSAKLLARRFWPGALTLIVKLNERKISPKVTGGTGIIGLRVPGHSCALRLIAACGGVLVGTSANRSGMPPINNAHQVINSIKGFDLLIEGQDTPGIESTVVKITGGKTVLIREGPIKRQQMRQVLARV